MPKARIKLPKKRLSVTLDDALFVSDHRVYVDLKTPHGDLLLSFEAENLGVLIGEIANSIRVNPMEPPPRPVLIAVGGR